MTPQQLSKIWTITSLVLLYYTLNAWIVSQGGSEVFGAKLIAPGRVLACVTAIPICSLLLIVTSLVGRLYAKRHGAHWHARAPILGFETLHTGSREGRAYQAATLFAFSILPWLGMIHFWRKTLQAKVVLNGTTTPIGPWDWSRWDWWRALAGGQPARMCEHLYAGPPTKCVDGLLGCQGWSRPCSVSCSRLRAMRRSATG